MSAQMKLREIGGREYLVVTSEKDGEMLFDMRDFNKKRFKYIDAKDAVWKLGKFGIPTLTLPPGELADGLREFVQGVDDEFEGLGAVVIFQAGPDISDSVANVFGSLCSVHDSSSSVGDVGGASNPTEGEARKGSSSTPDQPGTGAAS